MIRSVLPSFERAKLKAVHKAYNGRIASLVRACLAAWLLVLAPAGVRAQRLLDLPLRISAGADALAGGAAAAFWNPAGVARLSTRGEVVIVDVRGPDAIGMGAFALAAAVRLENGLSLAAGYQHTGTDDIARTDTSPLPEESGASFDLAEDAFSLSAAQRLGPVVTVGASARYTRASAIVDQRNDVGLGAGIEVRPSLPWNPAAAAAVRADDGGVTWVAGVEATPAGESGTEWSARVSLGAAGSPFHHDIAWRGAGSGAWREHVVISVGVAGEPDAAGTTWQPIMAIAVALDRYRLGILREDLPNGFGAFHSFHFSVAF
jgi:hypothetical protein